jgi:hypothetical protein
MNKRSLTEKEAAQYIGMNGIRKNRTPGPNYVKIGRTIRYLKEELDQWLETYKIPREIPADLTEAEN